MLAIDGYAVRLNAMKWRKMYTKDDKPRLSAPSAQEGAYAQSAAAAWLLGHL